MSGNACHDGARMSEPATESLIEQLHAGALAPGSLTVEQRRWCVAHLTERSLTAEEIAEVIGVTARTVHRDRAALRRELGVEPDLKLGDDLLGEFERVVSAANARLARLAQDANTSSYVRLWAEEAQVRNYQRLIQTAQRLDYVETGRTRLAAQRRSAQADPANSGYEDALAALRRLGGGGR